MTGHPAYIAAQGPLPGTVTDFWRMIWQYDVKIVVMASNEYEAGKVCILIAGSNNICKMIASKYYGVQKGCTGWLQCFYRPHPKDGGR